MNKLLVLLQCLTVAFTCVCAANLVYIETPVGLDSLSFASELVQKGVDIRGDRNDYVLAVDYNDAQSHIIFNDYNTATKAYFVLERADVAVAIDASAAIFREYRNVAVKSTYIFAVPLPQEDSFVQKIPALCAAVRIPSATLPAPASKTHNYKLPGAPDPIIANLITQVSSTALYDFVTYLTGEASSIYTRQSQSTGAVDAQKYLELTFAQYGFSVSAQPFRTGYSSNVIATLKGTKTPEKLVIVCSHYDSRGPTLTSTTQRAPGANDNGSGTGAVLQIAKIIYDNKLSFAYTVVMMTFSGEEQGLYGSQYAAGQLKSQKAEIIAVLNADMIAYRASNAAPQLDFASRSTTPALTTVLSNITKTYVNGLAVGSTTACCTDSASFYDQGYPSSSYCEKGGYTIDPMYHNSADLVNRAGYDYQTGGQYPLIVKAMLAGLLTVAEYQK